MSSTPCQPKRCSTPWPFPDAELAARLIEPMAQPIMQQGQASTVLGWLNALPEALIRARPFLCISHASLLTVTNQLEAAEARL
jgi:LuxR family maltose regulon positive regulatory protein